MSIKRMLPVADGSHMALSKLSLASKKASFDSVQNPPNSTFPALAPPRASALTLSGTSKSCTASVIGNRCRSPVVNADSTTKGVFDFMASATQVCQKVMQIQNTRTMISSSISMMIAITIQ